MEAPGQGPAAPISSADFSDVQRSEKSTSRRRENRRFEVSNANPNYTDKSQTDFIHTNQSIYPPAPSTKQPEMDGYELRKEYKESIRHEHLQRGFSAVSTLQHSHRNSPIQPFYRSIRFWGNASHDETYFSWTHKGNNCPAPSQRTAPPFGGAVQ